MIVHCKDCKFWDGEKVSCEGLARCNTGESGIRYRTSEDFCSRGVSKTEEKSCLEKTKGDLFREMTDEQLSEWLFIEHEPCDFCIHLSDNYECGSDDECKKGIIKWLKSKV